MSAGDGLAAPPSLAVGMSAPSPRPRPPRRVLLVISLCSSCAAPSHSLAAVRLLPCAGPGLLLGLGVDGSSTSRVGLTRRAVGGTAIGDFACRLEIADRPSRAGVVG